MEYNLLFVLVFSIILSIINLSYGIRTFGTLRNPFVFSLILLGIWSILVALNNLRITPSDILHFSLSLTNCILGLVFILGQFFFDEHTALYRQRKTMTVGALNFGVLIGFLVRDDASVITPSGNIQISTPIFLLFIVQAGLFIHRFNAHIVNQNSLSEHYALKNRYSSIIQKFGHVILIIILLISVIFTLFLKLDLVYTATILVPIGYILVTYTLFKDPLSAAAVGQKVQAVAFLSKKKVKFVQILASTGKSVVEDDDFSEFLNGVGDLMQEISKSETQLRSISTKDTLVMFEPCGEDMLIFILKYRGPALRKLIQKIATQIQERHVNTQEEFTTIVENTLLRTRQDLRIISLVDNQWLLVVNSKSARYKKALSKWELYFQRATVIDINELNKETLSKHNATHILIMGGDGTVHSVVNKLLQMKKDIPLGILPAGGGNDIFERWSNNHHNFSTDPMEYLEQPILEAQYEEKTIYIVNTVEWGVGAPTARLREANHGKLLFGTMKYFYLVLKALKKFYPWKSEVNIDGRTHKFENLSALLIGFGNSSIGGGFYLFPQEHRNPYKTYVMTAENYQKFHGLKIMFKLLRSSHFNEERIVYYHFNDIILRPNQDDVVVLTIDGELCEKPPVTIVKCETKVRTFNIY